MNLERINDACLLVAWLCSWIVLLGPLIHPYPIGPIYLGLPLYSGKQSILSFLVGVAAPIWFIKRRLP